jgi:transposase
VRDELLARLAHYDAALSTQDKLLDDVAGSFPQVEALTCIYGIGLYSALLIIAEIGEPWRFGEGRQVGAYAGLMARVHQSGSERYSGRITRQGSPWLRWILVEAAMKLVRRDVKLGNFHQRIRKRSSAKVARVAAARKLAGICWVRLMRWHRAAAA